MTSWLPKEILGGISEADLVNISEKIPREILSVIAKWIPEEISFTTFGNISKYFSGKS